MQTNNNNKMSLPKFPLTMRTITFFPDRYYILKYTLPTYFGIYKFKEVSEEQYNNSVNIPRSIYNPHTNQHIESRDTPDYYLCAYPVIVKIH